MTLLDTEACECAYPNNGSGEGDGSGNYCNNMPSDYCTSLNTAAFSWALKSDYVCPETALVSPPASDTDRSTYCECGTCDTEGYLIPDGSTTCECVYEPLADYNLA